MNVRGVGDAGAFQRLLWLVLGLVVLPTILLSLYGVSALRNQRALWLAAQEERRDARLHDAARAVFQEIARVDAELRDAVPACGVPCHPSLAGVGHTWSWRSGQPVPDALAAVGVTAPRAGEQTLWFGAGTPIGVTAVDGRVVAWELDLTHLEAAASAAMADRYPDGGTYHLVGSDPGPATTYEEMLARWQDPLPDRLDLDRPLGQLQLVIRWPDGDPGSGVVDYTRWGLGAGLLLLVGLVIVGALVTLVSAAREIRLSRLQTDFVSSVSHELRTPLTAIGLFVETLQSGRLEDPEQVEEALDHIAHETDRLSRLIERVLNWARMEAGRRKYELEEVPVSVLFDDALFALRSQRLLTEDSDVHVTVPADAPDLEVDRDAIVEALVNLLQNAVKYCPAPRHLVLSAEVRGDQVGLSVLDDGPGIPRRDRKRIFEKFYQSDVRLSAPSQSGANRGSGLGLAIVNAVARGHGGSVELESELGRGSRFTLWLPAASTKRASRG